MINIYTQVLRIIIKTVAVNIVFSEKLQISFGYVI